MKFRLKLFAVLVPLAALVVLGVAAGTLADVLIWIDNKCRDWFDDIYYGR